MAGYLSYNSFPPYKLTHTVTHTQSHTLTHTHTVTQSHTHSRSHSHTLTQSHSHIHYSFIAYPIKIYIVKLFRTVGSRAVI